MSKVICCDLIVIIEHVFTELGHDGWFMHLILNSLAPLIKTLSL